MRRDSPDSIQDMFPTRNHPSEEHREPAAETAANPGSPPEGGGRRPETGAAASAAADGDASKRALQAAPRPDGRIKAMPETKAKPKELACADCGAAVPDPAKRRRFCGGCVKQRRRDAAKERAKRPEVRARRAALRSDPERRAKERKRENARRLARAHGEGYDPATIACADCGEAVPRRSNRQQRCTACAEAHRLKHAQEYQQRPDVRANKNERRKAPKARRQENRRRRERYAGDPEYRAAVNARNREKRRNWTPEQRAADRENSRRRYRTREDVREKNRQYYMNHREKAKEYNRNYQRENRARIAKKQRAWRETPEGRLLRRAAHSRRRAVLRGADAVKLTPADYRAMLKRQKHRCAAAGCTVDLRVAGYELDHIEPLARGGRHVVENLQLLCPRHNREKWHRDPDEWARTEGGLLFHR